MFDAVTIFLNERAPDPAPVTILQPADPFLETVGEDLRRRIFITETADGALKCLRPEFTIPICLHHMSNEKPSGRYAYGGTVFRQGREGATEFAQAGLEDLGNENAVEADVQCLTDMVEALHLSGETDCQITLGDQQLFAVVVESLDLSKTLAERLVRSFGAPQVLANQIAKMVAGNGDTVADSELAQMAVIGDEASLTDKVLSLMEVAGLSPKSGRSAQDIARRMIEKSEESHFRLTSQQAQMLKEFLELELPLTKAADGLNTFAQSFDLDFAAPLEQFQLRAKKLSDNGIDISGFTYRASFGRKLDYYTGLLFEAHRKGAVEALAGGGRYDRLCTLLGAPNPIPAVGFSISLDRLHRGESA